MHDRIQVDWQAVEEAGFANLGLTLHNGYRAWKGFSWDLMDSRYERGGITNPRDKAKSVVLTEEDVANHDSHDRDYEPLPFHGAPGSAETSRSWTSSAASRGS